MNRLWMLSKSDLIPPSDPNSRIEDAIGCDGTECGLPVLNGDGSLDDVQPHWHLIESQPGAWKRRYPIFS